MEPLRGLGLDTDGPDESIPRRLGSPSRVGFRLISFFGFRVKVQG